MSLIAPVKPFFKYSMDMKLALPVVAYYCQLYGVQKGLEIVKNDTSGQDTGPHKKFLMGEMQTLEEMKKGLPEGTTKEDHRYVVENFVTSAFTNADKDERTCETITKKNAKDFNTCSHFIMLLSVFGDAYDEGEWEDKRKYCVFKAGSIMKALKAGEQPPRGNPSDPTNDGQREVPKPKQEEEKVPDAGPELPNMDDLMADLQKLEAGGAGGGPSGGMGGMGGMGMGGPPMPGPPMPSTDFNAMAGPDFGGMGGGGMMQQPQQFPSYQPSMQPPQYQPQQPMMPQPMMPQPVAPSMGMGGGMGGMGGAMGGGMMGGAGQTASSAGKAMEYFIDLGEAEKHIKHCQSEIDFNNAQGATNFLAQAIDLFKRHAGPAGQNVYLAPYQPKGNMQVNVTQRQQDNQQCKKLCKYAISEIDFNNVDHAINWLSQAYQILSKY